MAKRFRDTKIWDYDWYIDLPMKYKLLWQYILDDCDHAGIWKPNLKKFELVCEVEIELNDFLTYVNRDKNRVVCLENGNYLLPGFIHFQYGKKLNPFRNNAHLGIMRCLENNKVSADSLWGQIEVKEHPKDKEKEKVTERDKANESEKECGYSAKNQFSSALHKDDFRKNDLSRRVYKRDFKDLNENQKSVISTRN